ncbi:uncharacterized protein MONBRDRAFT_12181 [Monosiga brevicollis MX1]|uniref:Uncharacterized protein n=1 Tax=Monosiga brevicollis TaxID=81824 RepID=A9VBG5_MONBE|nr:uncharacterized protein MONBRDRAFT_12181 [Monosiga brevicollis MX1]EDQ85097.1 predicted protein [Monosiga brevicollis MX1]|eukprot:XP_001750101.1 hypothetical protein [Monosiga brevicollis MX1]
MAEFVFAVQQVPQARVLPYNVVPAQNHRAFLQEPWPNRLIDCLIELTYVDEVNQRDQPQEEASYHLHLRRAGGDAWLADRQNEVHDTLQFAPQTLDDLESFASIQPNEERAAAEVCLQTAKTEFEKAVGPNRRVTGISLSFTCVSRIGAWGGGGDPNAFIDPYAFIDPNIFGQLIMHYM